MGLISKSMIGQQEIQTFNWVSSQQQGISVCLPRDPSVIFQVNDYEYKGDLALREDVWDKIAKFNELLPMNKEEQEIVKLVGNLINGVTEVQALNDLRKLL